MNFSEGGPALPPTIKPIETRYKGYRFRSRLEARWAVFFDALGVKWEYEHEGWKIKTCSRTHYYLPDFYLPDIGIWYEVKGKATGADHGLMSHFRFEVGPIALSEGTPGLETIYAYDCHLYGWDLMTYEGEAIWGKVPYIKETSLVIWDGNAFKNKELSKHNANIQPGKWLFSCGKNDVDRSEIEIAYLKARSARFEFGESG